MVSVPSLSLEYHSAGANSSFGLGWTLGGLLSISLAPRKGLPRYDPDDDYSFSAAGELTPALDLTDGHWLPVEFESGSFAVRRFRPRFERGFFHVERWVDRSSGQVHWRTRDEQNTLTIYGLRPDGTSRISDPNDTWRVYEWLADAQFDARGNAILFEYQPEDLVGVDRSASFEAREIRSPSVIRHGFGMETRVLCGSVQLSRPTTGLPSKLCSTTGIVTMPAAPVMRGRLVQMRFRTSGPASTCERTGFAVGSCSSMTFPTSVVRRSSAPTN